jgi:hypothetical protein
MKGGGANERVRVLMKGGGTKERVRVLMWGEEVWGFSVLR